MKTITSLAAVLLALALAGCGSGSDKPTKADQSTDTSDADPKCSEVWKVGATLPSDYEGQCTGDGTIEVSGVYDCEDGSKMSTFDDRYFAKLGGVIAPGPEGADGKEDPALQAAYDEFANAC